MEKVEQDEGDGGMGSGVWVTVRVVRDLSLRRRLSRDLKVGSEHRDTWRSIPGGGHR